MTRLLLAHGASGDASTMRPHVAGLRGRGVDAVAVDLPRGRAERAVPVFARLLADTGEPAVIGGHSYGGRVASMLAATDQTGMIAGLVLLSYPLHRPGHPDEQRTEHWPDIRCPVLLLSGESDPFAKFDLLRAAISLLADAELTGYPGVGHGLAAVLPNALDRVAQFMSRLPV